MAEDFNDYGSYREYLEEEEFKRRPLIRKIFSFRALKGAVKFSGYFIVISVFAILFWRIFSSRNPQKAGELIWTADSYAAYEEQGSDLLIYSQDVGDVFDKEGKFSIYELRYIPATKEVQFTIRYNKSTLDTLAEELTEEARETLGEAFTTEDAVVADDFSDMPFVFTLRDDKGRVYKESKYITFTKGRYTYIRIAFSGIDLFSVEKETPEKYFPSPDVGNSDYIYKGSFASEYTEEAVKYLYLDSYYEGDEDKTESFSNQIIVYRTDRRTELYDYSDELPKGVTSDITESSYKKED